MFLNKTIFKKWIKDAYNHGGLKVGRNYGGMVLSGNYWVVWIDKCEIPNWVKAVVIEFAGTLPEDYQMFLAKKDEPIQTEIAENDYLDLPSRFMETKVPFNVTPVVYGTKWNEYRFLQNRRTMDLIALPEPLYSVIDMSNLDGNENRPMGPSSSSDKGDFLIWKNEKSAPSLCTAKIGNAGNEVMELLRQIDFEEVQ